jgi:hypothetical protein
MSQLKFRVKVTVGNNPAKVHKVITDSHYSAVVLVLEEYKENRNEIKVSCKAET